MAVFAQCDGSRECRADEHIEGCFAPLYVARRAHDGVLEDVVRLEEQLRGAVSRVEALEYALREAISWSYGEELTPERRDEIESLVPPLAGGSRAC